jgi:Uncharacterized conserved protein, contains double-stranded beta-helix domain
MKSLKIMSEGPNYSVTDIGEFDNLMDYSFLNPKTNKETQGKVFIGEILKTTGAEISFQIALPHTRVPFVHKHRNHEEIYIFLKGSGQFQVDNTVIDVKEGTIIRVSPDGKRLWRNNTENPMIFMVIQVQSGSLDHHLTFDGFRTEDEVVW